MGDTVTLQRWELYAGIAGLVLVGGLVGAPFAVAFYRHLIDLPAWADEVEQDLARLTRDAKSRAYPPRKG